MKFSKMLTESSVDPSSDMKTTKSLQVCFSKELSASDKNSPPLKIGRQMETLSILAYFKYLITETKTCFCDLS